MSSEITLSKGNYSVTIYTRQIEDGFKNQIFTVVVPKAKQTQDAGRSKPKVVDLLKITRSFRILGYIVNNTDKKNLIKIIEGAEKKGGAITMTYDDGGDTTTFSVFCESCIITQKAAGEPPSSPSDFAKFDVNITLIEGEVI